MIAKNAKIDHLDRETTPERDKIGIAIRQRQVSCLRDVPRLFILQLLHQGYSRCLQDEYQDEHSEKRVAAQRLLRWLIVRYIKDQEDPAAAHLCGDRLYEERDWLLFISQLPANRWATPFIASGTSGYEGSDAIDIYR